MLRRYLPKSLYARVALIVILPIFLMQSVITYIFFARHWELVTANLSANVAGQIAMVTDLYQEAESEDDRTDIEHRALQDLDLAVRFERGEGIPQRDELSVFNVYNSTFDRQLGDALERPYWFNTRSWPAFVEVRVQLREGILVFYAYRDRVFATTGPIFVLWLVGTSILLGSIAIVFLRNQVRSILRLATAAEAFGRGQDAPDYRPTGATEVRRAGYAFIAMRERIKRQLEQRTTMLAGVSHDLRTPLTRMKLALAMQPKTEETEDLNNDVAEMERMVEAYLSFARNEAADEDPEAFDLGVLIGEVARNTKRSGNHLYTDIPQSIQLNARRNAVKRAVSNLVSNGLRHAENVWLTVIRLDRHVEIIVDDDGPGISEDQYETVFRPFTRLDEARNLNESGMGLGLTVVRDVARSHGGDVILSKSERGGLRAVIRLPI
ncbi:MAG: ATP-binding protein [Pseudomonadota bacterium]